MSFALDAIAGSLPTTIDLSGASRTKIQSELSKLDSASITELIFDGCAELDLELLDSVDHSFPNLLALSLQNCKQIDSAGLSRMLGLRFCNLSKVNLSGCGQFTGLNLAMIVVQRNGNGLPPLRLIS